jgi:hypothetical protein
VRVYRFVLLHPGRNREDPHVLCAQANVGAAQLGGNRSSLAMTDVKTNEKQSPPNIQLLLPWHAAGTLNSRDAEDVDKALAQDEELARRFAGAPACPPRRKLSSGARHCAGIKCRVVRGKS